jgi:hypothetical protein
MRAIIYEILKCLLLCLGCPRRNDKVQTPCGDVTGPDVDTGPVSALESCNGVNVPATVLMMFAAFAYVGAARFILLLLVATPFWKRSIVGKFPGRFWGFRTQSNRANQARFRSAAEHSATA